ncbi:MAG: RnfABCDGE type electron transport complex subunit A [Bacteroides sp.]|nr:RnfABCDGE type electron transport complex subunit A [Eubacterium sp.]MCM1417226.1 RnfABCDGE type electron transport complex subunit A [Roseburia sp.]MCM1461153.1 RnfABCDGE type electron transport complex subunit A [Bacteroides sp.]
MELARNLMMILLTGILTENFILCKFFGICPFLGVSKTTSGAVGMGIAVTFVMIGATAVTFPLYHAILVPLNITYLNTICFILVIASFVQVVEMVLKKYVPPLYKSLGVYLPLITTNCAVLGVTVLNIDYEYNFIESLVNALAGGLGFLIMMVIFSGIRGRIEKCNVPKALAGTPVTLIAASITSLSFVGFGGIVEGIFGS